MGNKNMHKAKRNKNDEFYTQISDIEKEVFNYKECFKGKVVYCNTDNPDSDNEQNKSSQFWKYFVLNFETFGLKKLVASYYSENGDVYKYEYNGINKIKTKMEGNGDFRENESVELLKEADIIVTNPPFSLFREYVAQLMEYDKKFIIMGNFNAATYKEIFPLIKNNKIWLGYNSPKEFVQPDGTIKKFGNITWFTNIDITKKHEDIFLYKDYYGNEEKYPYYDNYNAINVDRVKDIPRDYTEVMGVPITFLIKYNPNQFKILGSQRWCKSQELLDIYTGTVIPSENDKKTLINGKETYDRIFIKRIN